MINLGGLEIKVSVKASDRFKEDLKDYSKLIGATAAMCIVVSTVAAYPVIKEAAADGWDDPEGLERQLVFSIEKRVNDESLPYYQRLILEAGLYLTWPGRQINYLMLLNEEE